MSQFTVFQELPKELRDHIWDLAIRDHSPAAHFFTIYDVWFDGIQVTQPQKVLDDISDRASLLDSVGLAAPRAQRANELSWVDGNKSAYMTDSGLWTACWESRTRMLWRFRTSNKAVTMGFRRDNNGERQYLTIQPEEDLLCFQFAKLSVIHPSKDMFWHCIQDLPTLQWRKPLERPFIRDVAVEVDPAWVSGWRPSARPDWPIRGFAEAGYVRELHGFWFINYALERRYKPDGDRTERRTFRAGGGLELVEVDGGDDEWFDRSAGPDAIDSGPPGNSLVHRLATYFQDELDSEDDSDEDSEYDGEWDSEDDSELDSEDDRDEDEPLPTHFGVLACVRRGSEKHLLTKSEWEEVPDLISCEDLPRTQQTGFANKKVNTSPALKSVAMSSCRKRPIRADGSTAGFSTELPLLKLGKW